MQNTYTIEQLALIAQRDRLAEASAIRRARLVTTGNRRPGAAHRFATAVREFVAATPNDMDFLPRLADYPTAH